MTKKGVTGFIGVVRKRTFNGSQTPEKEGYEMDKALEDAEGRREEELNTIPLEQRRIVP